MFGRDAQARRGTPADYLVVGLGNPGAEYAGTRHNVGFEVIERLCGRHGGSLKAAKRERALTAELRIGALRVAVAEPITYMNLSGEAVAPLVKRHGITDPHRLIVVHDELDLPAGRMKVKVGGGLAGHNGLRSIKAHCHTDDFVRIRIGVGKPASKERGADHVLSKVGKVEKQRLAVMVEHAADAVEIILADGVERAMERYNAIDETD